MFVECEDKYGPVEEMNVCDNLGDHLVGNVYVKFKKEEDADKAVKDLNNRWFGGRPIYAELTPVTDFREACCRFVIVLTIVKRKSSQSPVKVQVQSPKSKI